MVRRNHEKASGGPFFRSLLRSGGVNSPDLYEIVYYGMAQTEAQRWGLHGPYILSFTDGGAPATSLYARNRSTTWVDALGLQGWVGAAGRGKVTGVGIAGRDSSNPDAAAAIWRIGSWNGHPRRLQERDPEPLPPLRPPPRPAASPSVPTANSTPPSRTRSPPAPSKPTSPSGTSCG